MAPNRFWQSVFPRKRAPTARIEAEEENLLERDFGRVHDIEERMADHELPEIPGADYRIWVATPRTSGASKDYPLLRGDLPMLHPLGADCFSLGVADVSGHGLPAAHIKQLARGILYDQRRQYQQLRKAVETWQSEGSRRAVSNHERKWLVEFQKRASPKAFAAECAASVNEHMADWAHGDFISMIHGAYDAKKGVFHFVNAGHPPLLVYRARTGEVEEGSSLNPSLGIIKGHSFKAESVALRKGDALLLYTDGITEHPRQQQGRKPMTQSSHELFGTQRLKAVFKENGGKDVQSIERAVRRALFQFSHPRDRESELDKPVKDDATLIVLKRKR